MDRTVYTTIDQEKCIGCGECVKVCPNRTLSLRDGKAQVTGDRSLACGHCAAVCPTGAVAVSSNSPGATRFATFSSDEAWLPHGDCDAGELARLMLSRRSCRNYLERPVDRDLLEDLVKIGTTAPSGTNSQLWTFTVLADRAAVLDLAQAVSRFFEGLQAKAAKPWLRKGLALVGQRSLESYYQDYYQSVQEALDEYAATGKERLFHGAPAAILVGSRPGASCPVEDALLATQNILLGAHALGLGTCLVGFVVAALAHAKSARQSLGLDPGEQVHAVIALGWPDETYRRVAQRRPVRPRFIGG